MTLMKDSQEGQPEHVHLLYKVAVVCAVTMDDRQLDHEYLRLSQSGCFGRTSVSIVWYHSKASHSLQL